MEVTSKFENCNYKNPSLMEFGAESKIKLRITFPNHIPSSQSRNMIKEEAIEIIKNETKKYEWIIFGPIWVELTWFLDATNRQETDTTGDLDNITKPILDSLAGADGIFIDDSQTKSIYTRWLSKNAVIPEQILEIEIEYINEDTLTKDGLHFIQYNGPMCFPINLNPQDNEELEIITMFAEAKKMQRKVSGDLLANHGVNIESMLVAVQKDFHRTRLNGFQADKIFRLNI